MPTVALRPGEQVQIDITCLDVLAVFDDGTMGQPEFTTAGAATRSILAAVPARPVPRSSTQPSSSRR